MVGKNNKQNDYLTLRLADNDDLWMHTKNIPGSHVIIKCAGKEVPDNTVFEGAMLAAFFSKSKLSSQVPVDYTKRKNVKNLVVLNQVWLFMKLTVLFMLLLKKKQ